MRGGGWGVGHTVPTRAEGAELLEIIDGLEGSSACQAPPYAGAQRSFGVGAGKGGLRRVPGRAREDGAGEAGVDAERIVHVGGCSAAIAA